MALSVDEQALQLSDILNHTDEILLEYFSMRRKRSSMVFCDGLLDSELPPLQTAGDEGGVVRECGRQLCQMGDDIHRRYSENIQKVIESQRDSLDQRNGFYQAASTLISDFANRSPGTVFNIALVLALSWKSASTFPTEYEEKFRSYARDYIRGHFK